MSTMMTYCLSRSVASRRRRILVPNRTASLLAPFSPPAMPIGICGAAGIQWTTSAYRVILMNQARASYLNVFIEMRTHTGY